MRLNLRRQSIQKPESLHVVQIPKIATEPDYVRYEQLKRQLSDDLNEHEYSNAVRDIARECGV